MRHQLYAEYEEALRESNSLDFDDLLVFGLRLFRSAPRVLESCFHILVDEFQVGHLPTHLRPRSALTPHQDTNTTQYELMKCFAKAHGGVTVVGDPDQSIYGWRSAEVENLNRMTSGTMVSLARTRRHIDVSDFPGVQAIYLEENYRSTGSILSAAHSIVTQGTSQPASHGAYSFRPGSHTEKPVHLPSEEHARHSQALQHARDRSQLYSHRDQAAHSVFRRGAQSRRLCDPA